MSDNAEGLQCKHIYVMQDGAKEVRTSIAWRCDGGLLC
jgi:hypothetical protein